MKIAVLVSGGVDSSVALQLLRNQGYDITAFYLKIWLEDELSFLGTCPWEEDLAYVRAVCAQVGVPLEVVSFQKEYWDRVVRYTIADIKAGRTPNPDVMCNQQVKFGAFYEYMGKEFEKVATGHYAQVGVLPGYDERICLYRSPDAVKDQTYFLSQVCQAHLDRALFPIGHLTKEQVRAYAQMFDLPTKNRKDSQGICFLGKLKFSDFIRYHIGDVTGPLVEYETGMTVGEHKGFWYYTIGQRQGLGLSGGPWYVVAKNTETNTVFISRSYYDPYKARDNFTVTAVRWFSDTPVTNGQEFIIKIRHGAHDHRGTAMRLDNDRINVQLSERDQGIAPGQFAVFYEQYHENIVCVGGGVIEQ